MFVFRSDDTEGRLQEIANAINELYELQSTRQLVDFGQLQTMDMRPVSLRIPAALHQALKDESHKRRTSLNQLCVALLNNISGTDPVGA